jgi:uncharacterized membrane protein
MSEAHSRTITKAITWRIIATLIAAYWVGFSAAIVLNVIQTLAYYIHERVWLKINWGKITNT